MPYRRKQLQEYQTKNGAIVRAREIARKLNRPAYIVWYRLKGTYLPLGVELNEIPDWAPEPQNVAVVISEVLPDSTIRGRILPVPNIRAQLAYDAMSREQKTRIEDEAAKRNTTPVLMIRNGEWGIYGPIGTEVEAKS
jgi:hypothetical protein